MRKGVKEYSTIGAIFYVIKVNALDKNILYNNFYKKFIKIGIFNFQKCNIEIKFIKIK